MNVMSELFEALGAAARLGTEHYTQQIDEPPMMFRDEPELSEAWHDGWDAGLEKALTTADAQLPPPDAAAAGISCPA
ncbi:hypothetical protein [Rubrivivax gelatinosus]|nr:hypothetical protein [Rubrivivax gelatinosus]